MEKRVRPAELVPLDIFTENHPIAIDLVYASESHPENIFGKIYREGARLWMHRDLVAVTLLAAHYCARENPGLRFELKDCLRTVEAQTLMQQAPMVQRNPHWCEEPNRLLSPPGKGAHPRGMAVDVVLIDGNGHRLEMGTPFDYLSEDPERNPAARAFRDLPEEALHNRKILEGTFLKAADRFGLPLLPLPDEWWDFRFPSSVTEGFAPLWDADLPLQMRMTALCGSPAIQSDFPDWHFDDLKERIETRIKVALA